MNKFFSTAESHPASRIAVLAFAIVAIVFSRGVARAQGSVAPGNNLELERVLPNSADIDLDQPKHAAVEPSVTPTQQDFAPGEQDLTHPAQGVVQEPQDQDYLDQGVDPMHPAAAQTDDTDPLQPFNEKMFTFNLKMDEWLLRPVASGYASIAPKPVRQSIERFFDNAGVIPRFANNLFQLRFPEAGGEVARFGINSTLGLVGFFDPADSWFGLKEHKDDFGLTLRYYGAPTGPYVMLPLLGPSTVGDTIGMAVDHAMNPMSYLLPWPWYIEIPVGFAKRALETINYRSLRMDQFETADRYAVDLYGAVQDAYLQTREHETQQLLNPEPLPGNRDSSWALITAPATPEYPYGSWATPRGEWVQVNAFPGEMDCKLALEKQGAAGEEHPLECVPTTSKEYAQILRNNGH